MTFNKLTLVAACYFIGSAFVIYGAYSKIMHQENANIFLQIGLPLLYMFTVLAVLEIKAFKKVDYFIRWILIIGLLTMPIIAGFIYLRKLRTNIINT